MLYWIIHVLPPCPSPRTPTRHTEAEGRDRGPRLSAWGLSEARREDSPELDSGRLGPDCNGRFASRSLIRTWRKCALHTLGRRSPDSRLPTQQMRTPNRPSQGYCLIGVLGQLVADSGGTVPAWLRTSRLSPNRLHQALRSVARYPPADHRRLFGVRDSDRGMGASNYEARWEYT